MKITVFSQMGMSSQQFRIFQTQHLCTASTEGFQRSEKERRETKGERREEKKEREYFSNYGTTRELNLLMLRYLKIDLV
jgi:hypothetical protein